MVGLLQRIFAVRFEKNNYEQKDVLHNFRHPKMILNRPPDHVLGCFLYQSDTKSLIKSTEPWDWKTTRIPKTRGSPKQKIIEIITNTYFQRNRAPEPNASAKTTDALHKPSWLTSSSGVQLQMILKRTVATRTESRPTSRSAQALSQISRNAGALVDISRFAGLRSRLVR